MAVIVYTADGFTASQALTDSGTGNDVTANFSYVTGASFQLLITDQLKLCKIPKGAIIFDWGIFVPDIESSTGSLTLKLGLLTQDDDCYWTANQIGRAGGYGTPLTQASITNASLASNGSPGVSCLIPLTVTCATGQALIDGFDILALTAAAGATAAGAGGTLTGWVRYNMRGQVF